MANGKVRITPGRERVARIAPLRPIDSAGIPRMTSGDATDSAPHAAHGSVLADGQNKILAARRMEAALPADDMAERELIQPHDQDQQPRRDQNQSVPPNHDAPRVASDEAASACDVRVWAAHFLAARFAREINDCRRAAS